MSCDKDECGSCSKSGCASQPRRPNETNEQYEARMQMAQRMEHIKHKVLVLSGKGGVGKSTVAANLALYLVMNGRRVGLLDVDIHGPSIPTLMGLQSYRTAMGPNGMMPADVSASLKVMSIGFMLQERDTALIWRGPMKIGVIQQFLKDTDWGELDYLVVDCPPGTGDEPLSVAQCLGDADGAVIVTTPQALSISDVRKSITFCRKVSMPVLGVIENMAGFVCPHCSEITHIFGADGGEEMCEDMNIPYLGRIPLDPTIVAAGDSGEPFAYAKAETVAAKAMTDAFGPILDLDVADKSNQKNRSPSEAAAVVVAVPTAQERLASHFGHCETFTLFKVDQEGGEILSIQSIDAPDHQPGLLPKWLSEKGVNVVLAGGMGQRAVDLFRQEGIDVVSGAPTKIPKQVVESWLAGTLETGSNICDH